MIGSAQLSVAMRGCVLWCELSNLFPLKKVVQLKFYRITPNRATINLAPRMTSHFLSARGVLMGLQTWGHPYLLSKGVSPRHLPPAIVI